MSIKENWVNSDIIDNFFIYLKGVNILTPTYQYGDIYIYTHWYNFFDQFN